MSTDEIIWRPDPAASERTHIARFLRTHGLSLEGLQRRSVEDIAWYWDAVQRDLGWRWSTPFTRVVDLSRGVQWPRWFLGGRMNLADNCVDRHLAGPRRDAAAIVSEAEDGGVRTLTYAELGAEVARLANALRRLGVGRGRHRRRLPAHGAGGRHRHPRRVPDRRRLHPVLLGLRGPGGGDAARRLRRARAHHRRRLRPPGPAHPHEAHRRRGGGLVPVRSAT